MIARVRALPPRETLLAAVLIGVLTAVLFATLRASQPAAIASYSTYDADSGGARAWYELLEREGLHVERFERQALFLDRSLALLVWLDPLAFDPRQRVPSRAELTALESWVRGGGTFVYVGVDNDAARERVLKLPFARSQKGTHGRPVVAPALRAFGVDALSDPSDMRWKVGPGKTVLLADARGPLAVRYAYGRGRVVAVVDRDLFSNAGIGVGERARLAYALIAAEKPATIAFDETPHGFLVPQHWWEIVPRSFVIAVVLALLALAIGVVGAAVRLGPPILPRPRDDVTTSDFIAALASLLRVGRAQRSALQVASESTTASLARRFGLGDRATAQDVAAHIERDDDRRAFQAMREIADNGYPDDSNLVRGVALAQRLRKDLAPYADRHR